MLEKHTLASQFIQADSERALVAAVHREPSLYFEIQDAMPAEALTVVRADLEAIARAVAEQAPMPALAFEVEPAADPLATARELADLYRRRLIADLLEKGRKGLVSEAPGPLLSAIEAEAARIQRAVREQDAGQVFSLSDLLPSILLEARSRREIVQGSKTGVIGLPTGLPALDRALGGIQKGLHVLAAEPGQGKTTLALQIGASISSHGFPVLFVSFEEWLDRLYLKILCQRAGLVAKDYADGRKDPADLEKAAREHGPELGRFYAMEGSSRLDIQHVRAKALQLMSRNKANRCLIVVDYLQKWAAAKQDKRDFRLVVGGLCAELRELAMRLDSPVLAIASLNRDAYNDKGNDGQSKKRARMSNLKESGDLEYSADTVLLLDKDPKDKMTMEPARALSLFIDKNRYGPKDVSIDLTFKADVGRFYEKARI